VPVWIDTIEPSSPSAWSSDFLAPDAAEVLQALGAYILCFRKPVDEGEYERCRGMMEEVARVVRSAERRGWDGVCLVVLMRQETVPRLEVGMERWEELGMEGGWEVVDVEARGRNEFGEGQGVERVREAVEANDWAGGDEGEDGELDLDGLEDSDGEGSVGFGIDPEEMREEMEGMKRAIYGGGEDEESGEDEKKDVEEMEALMRKMQAMRGKSP